MTDHTDAAPNLTTAATNVADLLRARADEVGASTALVDGVDTITWAELDSQVDNLARAMSGLDLVGGYRVALALTNGAPMVTAYLAVLRAGMVAVPINPSSTPDEISRVLADSGSRLCFADGHTVGSVRAAVGETPVPLVVTGVEAESGELAYGDLPAGTSTVVTPRDVEALAVLLYTSGTSGRPRAAMLSHRALLANITQAASTDPPPVQAGDIVLGVLPLCHVYGLNAVLGQVLLTGATLVIGKRFDPAETLALIGSAGVTCVPVAPPVIGAWLAQEGIGERLSGVRRLLSGAGPLAEEVVREFESRTGHAVEQGYGLTEASPIVTSTVGTPTHKPGSAGRAIPGVELRIVDDSTSTPHDAEADDPGEIWVRGANVFTGYWPAGDGGPDADGWLHTGDIGFVDHDGDLFLVDRLKELVIVSGFNVYPSEIEDVISEVDGVIECAVIGRPDALTGEAVVAYLRVGHGTDRDDLVERVQEHCRSRLARFKIPESFELVDQLPRSATGKVAKGRLRATEARRAMGLS